MPNIMSIERQKGISPALAASTYVPYTGANADVTLGTHYLSAGYLVAGSLSTFFGGIEIEGNPIYSYGSPILQDDGNGGVALGTLAGYSAGNYNLSIGAYSLYSEYGGGSGNIGIGTNALFAQYGGYQNTAIGYLVAPSVGYGSYNVIIGDNAAVSLAKGMRNIIIGSGADYGGDNDDHLYIGTSAGMWIEAKTQGTGFHLNTNELVLDGYLTNGILRINSGSVGIASAGSDYLTSNQTITLSGDVSGSGATAITTTINSNPLMAQVYS